MTTLSDDAKDVLRQAIRLIELSLTRQDPSRATAIQCIQSLIEGRPWVKPPLRLPTDCELRETPRAEFNRWMEIE